MRNCLLPDGQDPPGTTSKEFAVHPAKQLPSGSSLEKRRGSRRIDSRGAQTPSS
jgi:hypothetical protein